MKLKAPKISSENKIKVVKAIKKYAKVAGAAVALAIGKDVSDVLKK